MNAQLIAGHEAAKKLLKKEAVFFLQMNYIFLLDTNLFYCKSNYKLREDESKKNC